MDIYIRKTDTKSLINNLEKFLASDGIILQSCSIKTFSNKTHPIQVDSIENIKKSITTTRSYFDEVKIARIHQITVNHLIPTPNNSGRNLIYDTSDNLWDKITINNQNYQVPEILLKSIYDFFPVSDQSIILKESFPEEIKKEIAVYQSTYNDMQASLAKLQDITNNQSIKNSDFLYNRQLELDEILKERSNNLETNYQSKYEQLESDFSEKESILKKERKVFEDEKKQFNLQENKAERRNLLKEMRATIEKQKEVKLSQSTINKRTPIKAACILSMILGAGIFIAAFVLLTLNPTETYYVGIISSGLILFSSTFIYFLRWNNSWLNSHAQLEFKNIQFSQDILRASWLAELVFEVGKESNKDVPPFMIEQFSKNLFTVNNKIERHHPIDDILKFSKSFKKVKVGKTGIEVEQDNE